MGSDALQHLGNACGLEHLSGCSATPPTGFFPGAVPLGEPEGELVQHVPPVDTGAALALQPATQPPSQFDIVLSVFRCALGNPGVACVPNVGSAVLRHACWPVGDRPVHTAAMSD